MHRPRFSTRAHTPAVSPILSYFCGLLRSSVKIRGLVPYQVNQEFPTKHMLPRKKYIYIQSRYHSFSFEKRGPVCPWLSTDAWARSAICSCLVWIHQEVQCQPGVGNHVQKLGPDQEPRLYDLPGHPGHFMKQEPTGCQAALHRDCHDHLSGFLLQSQALHQWARQMSFQSLGVADNI